MKIGIIFTNSIDNAPYLDKYINVLRENSIDYDIITWDRTPEIEKKDKYYCKYVYKYKSSIYKSLFDKMYAFVKYRRFLLSTIKKEKYDKLIVLTTLTSVLLYRILVKRNKGKYIFDYRDVSVERIPFFKSMLKKIIANSYFTCLSSKGFETILPEGKYVYAHNFQYENLKTETKFSKNETLPIKISQIGYLRECEFTKKICDIFADDNRFRVDFYGDGNRLKELIDYAKQYKNITFHGKFNNSDRKNFIEESDMFLYIYPNEFLNELALANKYYDGVIWKKPMITNANHYSGEKVINNGLGISIDYTDNSKTNADKCYDYYMNINSEGFTDNANRELSTILKEDLNYLAKIKEFIVK